MIKKIVLYTILLLLLAGLGFGGYVYFKSWRSFRVEMPAQTDRVVRINVAQIAKKLIKSDVETTTKDPIIKKIRASFDIPYNVLAFGVKSVSANVFFTKFSITDQDAFDSLLSMSFPNGKDSLRHNENGLMSIMYLKDDAAVIIWGNDTSKAVFNLANAYLNNKNVIDFNDSKLYEIAQSSSDLSSKGNMYNFNIDFNQGSITGSFVSSVQQDVSFGLKVPKDAALALIYKENFFGLLSRLGIKNIHENIGIDKLQTAVGQGFAFYIQGETEQLKSVVDYEFDDNFEKVAVTKNEVVKVPNFSLILPKVQQSNVEQIFKNNNLIFGTDSVNIALFPLLKMYYFVKPDKTFLLQSNTPIDTNIVTPIQLKKDADIIAWADFSQLEKMQIFAEVKSYLSVFDKMHLKHQSEDNYSFELQFKNKNSSSLRQLVQLIYKK